MIAFFNSSLDIVAKKPCWKKSWVTGKRPGAFKYATITEFNNGSKFTCEVERRGRGNKGRPRQLPKEVEEDLLAEVQRLRAENEYLKNLQALVLERERRQRKKPW